MDSEQQQDKQYMPPESFNDALIECVKACGGSLVVGKAIWPSLGEGARGKLLACLNPERAEKLSLDEIMLIMRRARDRGCHAGMQYLAHALSYGPPQPVQPVDEAAELQRAFIESVRKQQEILKRFESLPVQPVVAQSLRAVG